MQNANEAVLIIGALVILVVWMFIRRIRSLTRNMGLGFRTASGGDPTRERRVKSYVRGATFEERSQEAKWNKKARKTKNPRKKAKYQDRANVWSSRRKKAEKYALENTKPSKGLPSKPSHGIRRSGSERGRWL